MSQTTKYRALQTFPLGGPLPQVDYSYAAGMNQPIQFKQDRKASSYKIVLDSSDAQSTSSTANSDTWVMNIANFSPQIRGHLMLDRLQISTGGTSNQCSMGRVRINGFGNYTKSYDSSTGSSTNVLSILPIVANTINNLIPNDFTEAQTYPCPQMQLQGVNLEIIIDQSGFAAGATAKIPINKWQLILCIYDDGAS